MTTKNYISDLSGKNREAIIVASLGTISYELAEIDHPHKVLIRGAMGAAMGCALGIALNTNKKVICLIGDGSFLMKMGSISTILHHNLPNLEIHVIDNGQYLSCGGQKTNFKTVDQIVNSLPKFTVFKPVV